jgi:hypothetical protein
MSPLKVILFYILSHLEQILYYDIRTNSGTVINQKSNLSLLEAFTGQSFFNNSADGLLGTKNFEFTVQKLKPFKWESQE